MKNKFYFDEIYEATFIRAHDFIAAVMDGLTAGWWRVFASGWFAAARI